VQVVEAIKVDPINLFSVAVGAARVLMTSFVGVITFWITSFISGLIFMSGD